MTAEQGLPPKLADIVEMFQSAQGREKLELLLEFSQSMPPLPDRLNGRQNEMDFVSECQTPVYVTTERHNGGMEWFFDIPAESPTVRGYAGMLAEGLSGATPDQVLNVPADFFVPMGLSSVVSPQRMNGMSAILAHMKRLALSEKDAATS